MEDFFSHYRHRYNLRLLTTPETLHSEITEPNINRPALAMTGFTDVYANERIQVIGSTEWSYLESVGEDRRRELFENLARFPVPLWVLTHNLPAHAELIEMGQKYNMPVMATSESTLNFCRELQRSLEVWFAPYTAVHASLIDVYGVGMLYTGASNIGKSECVLDLVERGHRLVADDVVKLVRVGDSVIGRSNSIVNHHMEIRGVGIIDIRSMFGIHAVRKVKKVEVIVELQPWSSEANYDRIGLDSEYEDVLGISIPRTLVPVSPGKNITVISEVIAMNTLMKMNGIDAAAEFNRSLIRAIEQKSRQKTETPNEDEFATDFFE